MADELQGGLTLAGAETAGTPDPVTNPLAALQAQALAQGKAKQDYLTQQQAAYNKDMTEYAAQVAAARQPENNEAQMWGTMANAAALQRPMDSMGTMLARVGGAYGGFQESEQQSNLKNQGELTKMRQAEVRALEAKDQSAALTRALYGQNKGFEPRRNSDGTTTVYDKNTGIPVGTYGPQDIGKITQLTQTLAKAAVDKGDFKTLDEATQWAHGEAIRIVTASDKQVGNRKEPLAGNVGGVPTTPPAAPQAMRKPMLGERLSQRTDGAPVSEDWNRMAGETLAIEQSATETDNARPQDVETHKQNVQQLLEHIKTLPLDQQQDVMRNYARYTANPNAGTLKGVESSLTRAGSLPGQTTMPKLDIVRQAGEKETSVESAKTYAGLFAESVAKPAQAFANTGKIMQDFNTLGQMNHALKNGKLKEFMGGEAGKYALSFLPENSDLRKGIANAQEAEKLTAGMVNQILLAAKGVQTEGDAQRARSQVTSIGTDPDANKYLEAYINETARQLKMREQSGLDHKNAKGTFEGYDKTWSEHPIMKDAKGSVKKLGSEWIGVTQYVDKFKAKNPGATDADAVQYWNKVK